jgi:hypothetical protein
MSANISRQPLHPLWVAVQAEMSEAMAAYRSGIVPEQIIEGEQRRLFENYITRIISLIPGALIASGFSPTEAEKQYPEFIISLISVIESGDIAKFRRKIAAAAERLHFTRPVHRGSN